VVKPSRSGSALGVGFVERESDLASAVLSALSFSDAAIVERRIDGTEVAASLLGTPLTPLPLVEVMPKGGVYDYAARYTAGATEFVTPARLDDAVTAAVHDASTRAAEILGLRDLTRVDVIVDRSGAPWVLEVNVCPGMTETSLLPMAGHAAGMSLGDVCDAILQAGAARWSRSST
jgi:D-alanine-D-alanine ligase